MADEATSGVVACGAADKLVEGVVAFEPTEAVHAENVMARPVTKLTKMVRRNACMTCQAIGNV